MNETNSKKIQELMTNEEFAQRIADSGSYENAYRIFTENGVTASYDEFISFIENTGELLKQEGFIAEDGELGVELLDAVSGGGKFGAVCCWVAAGVAWSVCPPAGVALWLLGGCVWGNRRR